MTGTDTLLRTMARGIRAAAAVALTAAALSGCSGDNQGAPAWTAGSGPNPNGGVPSAEPSAGSTAPAAIPPSAGSGTPEPGSTVAVWKVFTDPGKTISFELPQEWIAQSVTPDQGTMAGALKIEVKDAQGGYLATLQTGLPPRPAAACTDDAAKPYTVVSSVPVALPHRGGDGTIEPHVVFRVIQGYRYFGSYGITNIVGGTAGTACALQNVVRGPEGMGDYSFADLTELKALAPDQKVAPAKAFDTLDQAASYVNEGSEFANIQRMLMSLKIKN
ncbi:hypothetical protein J2X01_002200 [Arthrobacter ginsengisoli]|uniref:Lipoprotein n=1 Tax=Arthrobacter ginsengisoli TaxID=1356565 RepID=A0ABU1UCP7_9MICC|nr:hypothetical protein [Arthrobacter ginsengisoli]MDR7082910.1 hypothetical protein [Arthrobacter ginsengisoli]